MIWQSVPVMTAIDLAIIAVVAFAVWSLVKKRSNIEKTKLRVGATLSVAGLLSITGLYLADLATMHVLPAFMTMEKAMGAMHHLHLDQGWLAIFGGVSLIVVGFVLTNNSLFDLNRDLKASATGLQGELARRREIEAAAVESHAQLQSILDHSPTAICLKDVDGRYLLVNREFERRHDVAGEDIIGKPAHAIFATEIADAFTQQDKDVLERGGVVEREQQTTLSTGFLTVLETKFPVFGPTGETIGVGLISTDITERKLAEEVLRESEARLRAIIDNSPLAITLKDADGLSERGPIQRPRRPPSKPVSIQRLARASISPTPDISHCGSCSRVVLSFS